MIFAQHQYFSVPFLSGLLRIVVLQPVFRSMFHQGWMTWFFE